MTAEFNEKNCAGCPAGEGGKVEKRDGNTVARECGLQQAIAKGRLAPQVTAEDRFPGVIQIRQRIETAFESVGELPECSAIKNSDTLERNISDPSHRAETRVSDPSHRTEARVVMTAEFNEKNCAECPASEGGEVENRGDGTVARECDLQQTITEGRLPSVVEILERIETAFESVGELPECSAIENSSTLGKNIGVRRRIENMLRWYVDVQEHYGS